MKQSIRRLGKTLLLAIPLLIGLFGFVYVEERPLVQSLFDCVCMYCLNYQDAPLNLWIEAARWLAPLATASGVVLLVQHFKAGIHNILAYCTGKSVAVFGPEEARADLLNELGAKGIPMDDTIVKAHQYVLLGEEQENLAFYQLHQHTLQKKDVFIQCKTLPAQVSTVPNLHFFCPEENAARQFWKNCCPYSLSAQKNHRLSITIIGFGSLGKEVLLSALQYNIFHRDQRIEYHILGEEHGFQQIYRRLSQISDPVFFHPEPWYDHMALLRDSDMIIIAEVPDQLAILRDISLTLPHKDLYVFTYQQGINLLQKNNAHIHPLDWHAGARSKDAILNTKLFDLAMAVNLRYAHLYSNVPEVKENLLPQWALLETFARYSNISTADYHDIRKIMMREKNWSVPLNAPQMEELAELEHIRWCRYHYLNNWEHGIPANGNVKDADARIHKSLVPYKDLSRQEQEKDHEIIKILLSLSPLESDR